MYFKIGIDGNVKVGVGRIFMVFSVEREENWIELWWLEFSGGVLFIIVGIFLFFIIVLVVKYEDL